MVKTTEKLRTMASDVGKYQGMLQGLITQGLCQLLEPNVVIRCRQNDIQLVKVQINPATLITVRLFCILLMLWPVQPQVVMICFLFSKLGSRSVT